MKEIKIITAIKLGLLPAFLLVSLSACASSTVSEPQSSEKAEIQSPKDVERKETSRPSGLKNIPGRPVNEAAKRDKILPVIAGSTFLGQEFYNSPNKNGMPEGFCDQFAEDFLYQKSFEYIEPFLVTDYRDDPALDPYYKKLGKDFLTTEIFYQGIELGRSETFSAEANIKLYNVTIDGKDMILVFGDDWYGRGRYELYSKKTNDKLGAISATGTIMDGLYHSEVETGLIEYKDNIFIFDYYLYRLYLRGFIFNSKEKTYCGFDVEPKS